MISLRTFLQNKKRPVSDLFNFPSSGFYTKEMKNTYLHVVKWNVGILQFTSPTKINIEYRMHISIKDQRSKSKY